MEFLEVGYEVVDPLCVQELIIRRVSYIKKLIGRKKNGPCE